MSVNAHILLDDQVAGTVRVYDRPLDVITAWTSDDISKAFQRLTDYQARGYFLAGFAAYELGHVFEPHLQGFIPKNPDIPLLRFGVYKSYHTVSESLFNPCTTAPELNLTPAWSEAEYLKRFEKVIAYIKAGDVYQINLTFPMRGEYNGTGIDLYTCLRKRQPGQFGGVLSFDDFDIISLSPELFFQSRGDQIDMRPMKGTARRLPDPDADEAVREAMRYDEKSRAENLMIVDLLRNDLSRIAEKGSVKVPELFALETYPTLHQMTSRVQARLQPDIGIVDLFRSLFPCGSVTGAPKIRAMEIIHELEGSPRGPYCGAIGFIDPADEKGFAESCFNVAIRTFTLKDGKISYSVGSGVVLDSDGPDEYAECRLKAAVTAPAKPYLIETLKYDPNRGPVRGDRHMARLVRSAGNLGYKCDKDEIRRLLNSVSEDDPLRLRMTLTAEGEVSLSQLPFTDLATPVKISLSQNPLTPDVQETRYKLSAREFYESELARIKEKTGCAEILFFNARNELCEGSFTSVFVEKDGILFTPDITCGLLPGVLREEMLQSGRAREAILTLENLLEADAVYVGNSLRGLMRAELISETRQ